jgi:hypothetical protein
MNSELNYPQFEMKGSLNNDALLVVGHLSENPSKHLQAKLEYSRWHLEKSELS